MQQEEKKEQTGLLTINFEVFYSLKGFTALMLILATHRAEYKSLHRGCEVRCRESGDGNKEEDLLLACPYCGKLAHTTVSTFAVTPDGKWHNMDNPVVIEENANLKFKFFIEGNNCFTQHKRECPKRQKPKVCNTCKKPKLPFLHGVASLHKCSRCEKVYYCSVDCQKQDWKKHKEGCGGAHEKIEEPDVPWVAAVLHPPPKISS
jgi:hypothetical protein